MSQERGQTDLARVVDALWKALGFSSRSAFWEAAGITNKNYWNKRLAGTVPTSKKHIDQLVQGLHQAGYIITPQQVASLYTASGMTIGIQVYSDSRDEHSEEKLDLYRQRTLTETHFVNLAGIPLPRDSSSRPVALRVPLDTVYIRLQAIPETYSRAQQEEERRQIERQIEDSKPTDYQSTNVLVTLRTLGEYLYRQGQVYQGAARPDPVDPLTALREHHRLVILGAPGAGKSTLLRYLARTAAGNPNGEIPILVSLRDYATYCGMGGADSLHDFALKQAAQGDEILHQVLRKAPQLLWLVDALDEAYGWRDHVVRQIGQLEGALIVTSRPVDYRPGGLEVLSHFEVLPLVPEDVDRFLQNWFSILANQRVLDDHWIAERVTWLKQQLDQRRQILPLTRNPLLLTFLVILAGEDVLRDLPTQRAALYHRYVEELFDSWEIHRRSRSGSDGAPTFYLGVLSGDVARHAALQGFYHIGWRLQLAYHDRPQDYRPSYDALVDSLAHSLILEWRLILGEAKVVAAAILEFWLEAGILERWRIGINEYLAFRHLTFQEFAAAHGLVAAWERDSRRTWSFLRPRLHHYAWREPILMFTGMIEPRHLHKVIDHLLYGVSHYELALHRDFRLAVAIMSEGTPLSAKQNWQIVQRLVWLTLPHYFETQVILVLTYIFGLVAISETPFLITWGTWIPSLVWTALWSLLLVGVIPGYRWLLILPMYFWNCTPDPSLFLGLLCQIGLPAVPALSKMAAKGGSSAREVIAEVLGQIDGVATVPKAVSTFAQALSDRNNSIREKVAQALGQIGAVEAVPALIQIRTRSNIKVQKTIEAALWQISLVQTSPKIIEALAESDLKGLARTPWKRMSAMPVSTLVQALRADHPFVRRIAVATLGQVGAKEVAPMLVQALRDNDRSVRQAATTALGGMDAAKVIPTLIQALHDNHPSVRSGAAAALRQIGAIEAVPALLQILHDSDANVRWNAAAALGQIGAIEAVPMLIQALHDSEANVRQMAAAALGQIGAVEAIPVLIQALRDNHPPVRRNAAAALGQIGAIEAVPMLIQVLHDSEANVRHTAIVALGRIGTVEAVSVLAQALHHSDTSVRWYAATALGQIGGTDAVLALVQALLDGDNYVKSRAADALGKLEAMEAVPALIQMLNHYNRHTQSNAATALGQIGATEAVPALIQVLDHSHSDTQSNAATALAQIGAREAVRTLVQVLRDSKTSVRWSAADALGKLGATEAVPLLIEVLSHSDRDARRAAAIALGKLVTFLEDQRLVRHLVRSLWRQLPDDLLNGNTEIFYSLEHAANRLAVLEVLARPGGDPLLLS